MDKSHSHIQDKSDWTSLKASVSEYVALLKRAGLTGAVCFVLILAVCHNSVLDHFSGNGAQKNTRALADWDALILPTTKTKKSFPANTMGDAYLEFEAEDLDSPEIDLQDPIAVLSDVSLISEYLIDEALSLLGFDNNPGITSVAPNSDSWDLGVGGINNFELAIESTALHVDPNKQESLASLDTMQRVISTSPVGSPVVGDISSRYGYRRSPFTRRRAFHSGIDIAAAYGAQVLATADGIVTFAKRKGGYGRTVIIKHKNGNETLYGHLSRIFVKPGDKVCRGQSIALVGNSGRSTGPHIHYEVRQKGKIVNPKPFIDLASTLRFAR